VLEHVVGQPHLADVGVVTAGQRFAVVRQIRELAAFLCLADEALGDSLPGGLDHRVALGVTANGAHAALEDLVRDDTNGDAGVSEGALQAAAAPRAGAICRRWGRWQRCRPRWET